MTIDEAFKHLWLQEASSPKRRLRRRSSHEILVNKDFHHEFKNRQWHTLAKEEGSTGNEEGRMLTGSIQLSD